MDFMYLESDRSLIVVSRNLEYDYCDSKDYVGAPEASPSLLVKKGNMNQKH